MGVEKKIRLDVRATFEKMYKCIHTRYILLCYIEVTVVPGARENKPRFIFVRIRNKTGITYSLTEW